METKIYTKYNHSKQHIISYLEPIETDYPQFEGDIYSNVPFYKFFDTQKYTIEVEGYVCVKWFSHEDYEYHDLENVKITMFDDDGKVEVTDDMYELILTHLEFSTI